MATQPVLDISTLIERETVRIDGRPYELRTSAELSILDLTRLQRLTLRVQEIDRQAELTPEQRAEYEHLTDQAVRLLLVAPDDVMARLQTAHREAILWTFIGLSQPSLGLTRAAHETPATTTATARAYSRSARGLRGSSARHRTTG